MIAQTLFALILVYSGPATPVIVGYFESANACAHAKTETQSNIRAGSWDAKCIKLNDVIVPRK